MAITTVGPVFEETKRRGLRTAETIGKNYNYNILEFLNITITCVTYIYTYKNICTRKQRLIKYL